VLRRADQIAKACHQGVAGQNARRCPDVAARKQSERTAPAIGVSALSGAEQKVAELAANGHSNREIGRKLSITVSTVEQHLTRVYRKLNVSRRTDLLSELSRHDAIDQTPVTDEPRVLVPR
jgi:DNA-binding CsgD family transcriptional regulator